MYKVGLVVMVFAFVNSAVSVIGGRIVKYVGRVPICTFGWIVDIILIVSEHLLYYIWHDLNFEPGRVDI